MPRILARPTLALLSALLGAFLGLTACVPTATVSVSPTATLRPAPTATPTLAPAPTPTNVPAGWKVLATTQFSLAYPPDWTTKTLSGGPRYFIMAPTQQSQVIVVAVPRGDVSPYCLSANSGAQHTTFAGLPMTYQLTGEGNTLRSWYFANTERTFYSLQADDSQADAAAQAQDEAILATFRPDNADPWTC